MRIAGINSPNYHLNQPNQPKKHSANGHLVERDAGLPQNADSTTSARGTENFVTQRNTALTQVSAKNENPQSERIQFYSQNDVAGVWSAFASNGQSAASPDNTSHKARTAISQYLQTQYIEERQQFKAVLGIDEYA
ncbi:MAG: hypothetical protein AMJ53_03330 [Gammaproteobacteria bacterium SG8_11]|nr:MAG: hypothetical protein AMJ53_03330 [Gammaproteobacteria bacterium SG8_11]